MDLSVALIIAASFAILCTFYIGKRILTIDFFGIQLQKL